MVTVLLPGALASLAGGGRRVQVEVSSGAVLADVLDQLGSEHPLLERRIRDETGSLRRYVNVYLDGQDVRDLDAVATSVTPDAELQVVASVAGG